MTSQFVSNSPLTPPTQNLWEYEEGLVVELPEFLEMVEDIWRSGFCGIILDSVDEWCDVEPFATGWFGQQPNRPWHPEAGRDMAHDYLAYEEKYREDQARSLFPEEYV